MKHCIVVLAAIIATLSSVAQANCLPEWTEWNKHCYGYTGQYRKSWEDASEECKQASPNKDGHLVTIDSEAENEFVRKWWVKMQSPLRGSKWQYLWTGLNDIKEEGKFVWSDGTSLGFKNWGGGQPENRFNNSNCVAMAVRRAKDKGMWDDARCFGRRSYICEYTCTTCGKDKVKT